MVDNTLPTSIGARFVLHHMAINHMTQYVPTHTIGHLRDSDEILLNYFCTKNLDLTQIFNTPRSRREYSSNSPINAAISIHPTQVPLLVSVLGLYFPPRAFTEKQLINFKLNFDYKFRKLQKCEPSLNSRPLSESLQVKPLGYHGVQYGQLTSY